MGTLQQELIEKGLATIATTEPREEFIKGEIQDALKKAAHEQARYKKASENFFEANRMRHGRTVRREIPSMLGISKGMIIIDYLKRFAINDALTTADIAQGIKMYHHSTVNLSKDSLSAYLSVMRKADVVKAESVAGKNGFGYRIADDGKDTDTLYAMYCEAARKKGKAEKQKVEIVKEQKKSVAPHKNKNSEMRVQSVFPETVNIIISGNIEITFKIGR